MHLNAGDAGVRRTFTVIGNYQNFDLHKRVS